MVIGFEPVPSSVDFIWTNHAQQFNGRYVVINAAVADFDGVTVFHEKKEDTGTSTMLNIDKENVLESAKRREAIHVGITFEDQRKYFVPVFRLEPLLQAIPDNITIAHLKVDAQGVDCQVLLGCGELISRIKTVRAEVGLLQRVYKGQCTKEDMLSLMSERGFKMEKIDVNPDGGEADIDFIPV